jgi:hypothetical protein
MADRKDEHRTNTDRALALRDVIGAWLICGAIAAMALASSGNPRAPTTAPPASALTTPRNYAVYGTKCGFGARSELLCAASANNARRVQSHQCCRQAL